MPGANQNRKSEELLQHEELHTYKTMMREAAKQRDPRNRLLRMEKEAFEIKKMIDKKESRGAAEDHLYNAIHKNAAAIGPERISSLIEKTVRMMHHQDDIPLCIELCVEDLKAKLSDFGSDQIRKRNALLLDIAKEAWTDHDRKRSKPNLTNEDAHVELEKRDQALVELTSSEKLKVRFLLSDTNLNTSPIKEGGQFTFNHMAY